MFLNEVIRVNYNQTSDNIDSNLKFKVVKPPV